MKCRRKLPIIIWLKSLPTKLRQRRSAHGLIGAPDFCSSALSAGQTRYESAWPGWIALRLQPLQRQGRRFSDSRMAMERLFQAFSWLNFLLGAEHHRPKFSAPD